MFAEGQVVLLTAHFPGQQARIIRLNNDGSSATVELLTGNKKGRWTGVLLKDCQLVEGEE